MTATEPQIRPHSEPHSEPAGAECTALHTRLLKCALQVEESRAFWRHAEAAGSVTARAAFEATWFGNKSLDRVEVLLANLRARFAVFPQVLACLHRWPDMSLETRRLVCHWHLQLSDPLYRVFTDAFLGARRESLRGDVSRDTVITWVGTQGPTRWRMATRVQFASKLLSAAYAAGLLETARDPRPVVYPRVPDDALAYLLYLLRQTRFAGTLTDNPYLRSVGLTGAYLWERLSALPGLSAQRQADVADFAWAAPDLLTWSQRVFATNPPPPLREALPAGACP